MPVSCTVSTHCMPGWRNMSVHRCRSQTPERHKTSSFAYWNMEPDQLPATLLNNPFSGSTSTCLNMNTIGQVSSAPQTSCWCFSRHDSQKECKHGRVLGLLGLGAERALEIESGVSGQRICFDICRLAACARNAATAC